MNEAKIYGKENGCRVADCRLNYVFDFLPTPIVREITSLIRSLRLGRGELEEIRIRRDGQSSITLFGRNIPLLARVCQREFERTLSYICKDGIYAFKSTMQRGYIPLDFGIRCALVGSLRYDGEEPSGVGEISSVAFRLPLGVCLFAKDMLKRWDMKGGLLILSPPLGGKTTALRSIASELGTGKSARRVALIDERGEFCSSDFNGTLVDLFRGYRREIGTEIAIRTMSAEIIIMDEIGEGEDVSALLYANRSGALTVASAHADSLDGAMKRELLRPLFEGGVFSSVAVIEKKGDVRDFSFFYKDENEWREKC